MDTVGLFPVLAVSAVLFTTGVAGVLTRRNAPAPHETTADDMAQVFGSAFDAAQSRRVQNILKALLKR